MVPLFSQPIESLTAADLVPLIGWPESLTVEYKRELPTREGRPARWVNGGELEEHARNKIFKEVIALANTVGGHVILGISETETSPPVAGSISPIPRCALLAERLEQAAQSIDPPIPLLLVRAICTEGDAGVVIFRVPQSWAAPHRGLDKECYVRRGTSSSPVGMREIQDMTIAIGRRSSRVDAAFFDASKTFRVWSQQINLGPLPNVFFRITACPVQAVFNLPNLDGPRILSVMRETRVAIVSSRRFHLSAAHLPYQTRPIIRGLRVSNRDGDSATFINVTRDGLVTFGFANQSPGNEPMIALEWVLAHAANVLEVANLLRSLAGQPDAEYAVELEISATPSIEQNVGLHAFGGRRGGFRAPFKTLVRRGIGDS
jgi:hypothetical protein